ncbi:MAG: ATP cone domain-containing protein [Patescibacteria group bacterium]
MQKKDGTLEEFDKNKILNGVVRAGASSEDAQKILNEIEAWLPGAQVNGIVKSVDIRTKGLEILDIINPEVAKGFRSYQKPI